MNKEGLENAMRVKHHLFEYEGRICDNCGGSRVSLDKTFNRYICKDCGKIQDEHYDGKSCGE